MSTMLVRLKPHDPRRGCVLRRFAYRGIKFHQERGWYRVEQAVADYLCAVRQVAGDEHSPLGFDVCTDDEAKALDAREKEGAVPRAAATDDIKVSEARMNGPIAAEDQPETPPMPSTGSRNSGRKTRKR